MGEKLHTIDDGIEPNVQWAEPLVDLFVDRRVDLVRLAYLLTGHQAIAEEVVQDAFINTQRAWNRVEHPWSYLRSAVVNGCRSWGRRQAVAQAHPPDRPEPDLLEADELWDALNALDERRRTALILRYYLDLPTAEIADILGCRPATARTMIHRGLRQLRKDIEQ